ncbi:hypothetical protein GXB81_06610 [Paraburkholderia sp. Ac-20336]|uniref:hypothetical protein n=1 Tax=unclassified Paraburkholderia TaxID=2615204 RepID=UPI001421322B|nr:MULTISPECIES: hypothetical protein [unclassified Paraburkholderia]MBN3802728.1 hypothetical protein [Paraburkholderia sp. Ac-20336]MBN3849983.1 hypothetical protein [Paraburkholderia sp. Ac-20342]NIF79667.1 hypothetical protein [Paraburkholderia sp. Cy-641]
MKRLTLIGGCLAGLALSCLGGMQLTRFLLQHFTFDIPSWLSAIVRHAIRLIYADYQPDALDIQDTCILLLFIASSLCIAAIIALLSFIARRRFVARNRLNQPD